MTFLRRWRQYLNRCMVASASEVVEAPGASAPFSLEPILVNLKGGRYIGPVFPVSLSDLVSVRRSACRGAPKSGGSINCGCSSRSVAVAA